MRTRDRIFEAWREVGSRDGAANPLILEVLLDIRDLLQDKEEVNATINTTGIECSKCGKGHPKGTECFKEEVKGGCEVILPDYPNCRKARCKCKCLVPSNVHFADCPIVEFHPPIPEKLSTYGLDNTEEGLNRMKINEILDYLDKTKK